MGVEWAFFSNFSLILRGNVRKRKEKNSKDKVSLTMASLSVHQQHIQWHFFLILRNETLYCFWRKQEIWGEYKREWKQKRKRYER